MQQAMLTPQVSGLTLRQAALVAGITYAVNPVTFAQAYAMPRLFAANPGQTVANITAHPHLFSAAVLSYFFSLVGDVVFAWAFYVLLAPVNRALSLLAAWLQLTYAAISIAALANLGLLYRVILIPSYSQSMSPSLFAPQATLLLAGFRSGWCFGLILFGLHLAVLGWLMAHSTYLPHWLGWLIFLDGWAWVVDNLSIYLYPDANLAFLKVFFAAELVLMVWLLGWGWRIVEPQHSFVRQT